MEFALLQIVNMGLLGNIHDVKVSPIIFLRECCVILAGAAQLVVNAEAGRFCLGYSS